MTRLSEFFEPRWQINRTRGGGRRNIQSAEGRRGARDDPWMCGRGAGAQGWDIAWDWALGLIVLPGSFNQAGLQDPRWRWRIVRWCYKNTCIGIGIRIVGIFNSIIFIASCLLTWIFKAMKFSLTSVNSAVLFLVYLAILDVGFYFFFNLNVA